MKWKLNSLEKVNILKVTKSGTIHTLKGLLTKEISEIEKIVGGQ